MSITVFDRSTRLGLMVVEHLKLLEEEHDNTPVDIMVAPYVAKHNVVNVNGLFLTVAVNPEFLAVDIPVFGMGISIYEDELSGRIQVTFGSADAFEDHEPLAMDVDEYLDRVGNDPNPASDLEANPAMCFWSSFNNPSEAASFIWSVVANNEIP